MASITRILFRLAKNANSLIGEAERMDQRRNYFFTLVKCHLKPQTTKERQTFPISFVYIYDVYNAEINKRLANKILPIISAIN